MSKNKALLAAAGAGKTERIINHVLSNLDARVLITTFTNNNANQISARLRSTHGFIPQSTHIMTWPTFLLRETVKPYQPSLLDISPFSIRSIHFEPRNRFIPKRVRHYYLTVSNNVYNDALSEMACQLNAVTAGAVIRRLERMYDYILIDEFQDLAGYDLDLVRSLLESRISIIIAGDPRQCTFATNRSQKNKKHRRKGLEQWLRELHSNSHIEIQHMNWSYRCNASICRLADIIYPSELASPTETRNSCATHHDGIYLVAANDVGEYLERFQPMPLRYSRSVKLIESLQKHSIPTENIGNTKGLTYDRVLIVPTKPMLDFLKSGDPSECGDREKLYIAVTRARFSVAFIVPNRKVASPLATLWTPDLVLFES